jgi:hypothetical protein
VSEHEVRIAKRALARRIVDVRIMYLRVILAAVRAAGRPT